MSDEIETDRQPGCAHPRETFSFFGQEKAEADLARALQSGYMHHAWLLTGPEGVGKATLAYRAARVLLGARVISSLNTDPEDPVSRQIAAQSHPDLLVLRRAVEGGKAKTAVTVDVARQLPEFFAKSASHNGARVAIIDTADDMNENAANAILKTLEEPPPRGVIFLLARTPGRLLPTIRSRCRVLRLPPVATPAITDALISTTAMSVDRAQTLAQLANGAPGRALALAASNADELYTEILEMLGRMPDVADGEVLKFAERMKKPGAEPAYALARTVLLSVMTELARLQSGQGQLEDLRPIASRAPAAAWAQLAQSSEALLSTADRLNIDKGDVMVRLLDSFQDTLSTTPVIS